MGEQTNQSTRAALLPDDSGPIVVVNKGHSGSRFIAQALAEAGVFMGADMNAAFDSMSWHEDFAVPLMNTEWFPEWPSTSAAFDAELQQRFAATVDRFTAGKRIEGPWGWKGSTLFVSQLILDRFPETRLLHIVRDGRDVALSRDGQLNLPFHYPADRRNPMKRAKQHLDGLMQRGSRDDYRQKVFFGRSDLKEWNGVSLNRSSVQANRFLLQMQSWVHNVTVAREFGAQIGEHYKEIRYEELCQEPRAVMTGVLEWCGLPITDAALRFVDGAARTGSIDKWRSLDLAPDRRPDFERACEHGRPLLAELGYDVTSM